MGRLVWYPSDWAGWGLLGSITMVPSQQTAANRFKQEQVTNDDYVDDGSRVERYI